jgi:hypothetical protein
MDTELQGYPNALTFSSLGRVVVVVLLTVFSLAVGLWVVCLVLHPPPPKRASVPPHLD